MANPASHRPPEPISDWYELVEGRELEQGDIIESCPIFFVERPAAWPIPPEQTDIPVRMERRTVIIMTQSCDLDSVTQTGGTSVVVCPVLTLDQAEQQNAWLATAYGKEDCRAGNMTRCTMLDSCSHERWKRPHLIVYFPETWTLRLDFLQDIAGLSGPRARLRSPYKEYLAQAYGLYFMRVALPTDIARFEMTRDVKEIHKRIAHLSNEERAQVIAALTKGSKDG